MPVVGPGSTQEITVNPAATLDGASEYEYVTILNPLSDDFAVRVAIDVPVNMPFSIGRDTSGRTSQITQNERDAAQTYGLNLKNPDFTGRKHIVNDTIIKSGQTINLKGNEAQVAVRQLVNEIIQREGRTKLMSDPNIRREVEERIIISRGSIQDLMDAQFNSPRQQATEAINRSNEVSNEQPSTGSTYTPTVTAPEAGGSSGDDSSAQERRSPGRPKKA